MWSVNNYNTLNAHAPSNLRRQKDVEGNGADSVGSCVPTFSLTDHDLVVAAVTDFPLPQIPDFQSSSGNGNRFFRYDKEVSVTISVTIF